MLHCSFQHLPGVSPRRERELWRQGVSTWDEFERTACRQLSMFGNRLSLSLSATRQAASRRDVEFFAERLPRREHYRIALEYPEDTLFFDIETTGLSRYYDTITMIGWACGKRYGAYVQGGSLDSLREALSRAKVLVTFNGSLFDVPFVRSQFPDIELPASHVDLRFLGRRAGLAGPQKEIEAQLGLARDPDLEELDGKAATVLWHHYRKGDLGSLERLIRYNHADVEGMKAIFDAAIDRLLQKDSVPHAIHPRVRFSEHKSTIVWAHDGSSSRPGGVRLTDYQGNPGPSITYGGLVAGSARMQLRVVGIDLTGSEDRASGWCRLEGDRADTELLSTDEEIVQRTVQARPHLVSIDSPLSLPAGRTRAGDDDPVRDEYGITRLCERVLRARGVSVYPCLIPSMQRLTVRGMRIADSLRKKGVPVIESYPGAAQDILGIPRKRTSLELLSAGLEEFGLRGPWTRSRVSHDELDAITSALVGVFFWCDRFEQLGNEVEDYLIIPDLRANPQLRRERQVIGVSGPIAAGKTTMAKILEGRGYSYARFSMVLAKLLQARGRRVSRGALQRLGAEVHRDPGQRWLCRRLVEELPAEGDLVIDGLRHPEDHAFFVETFGPAFKHIHIDAPEELRSERYQAQGNSSRAFVKAIRHGVESNVPAMGLLSHTAIDNSGKLTALPALVKRASRRRPRRRA